MSKINLTTIAGGYASTDALNDNFDAIEDGFDNTLSRDGTTPNSMAADLDMDSNKVINLAAPDNDNDAARKVDLTDLTTFTDTTLPAQAGNANRVLGTNGTVQAWVLAATPVANKAAAAAMEPVNGAAIVVLSDDGANRIFKALVGAAPGTYVDDDSVYCGTLFIPSGGDGSAAWAAVYDVIDVRWFGLVGDGITDNSSQFDKLLTFSRVNSPSTIFFPAGVYLCNSSLSTVLSASDITITGEGDHLATIRFSSSISTSNNLLLFNGGENIYINNINIDFDNYTATAVSAAIQMQQVTNPRINNCVITNYPSMAIGIQSCNNYNVSYNNIIRTTAISSTNYAINVSSDISTSDTGKIQDNYIERSGVGVWGTNCTIKCNYIISCGYGAALYTAVPNGSTITSVNSAFHVIVNNTFSYGTGLDDDGFPVCGIENGAQFSIINDNLIHSNAGNGIRNFGISSKISGNNCYNNGTYATPPAVYHHAGIASVWTINASGSGSTIDGNKCTDSGGATQTYGYYDQSVNLTGVVVRGNDFTGNATGEAVLVATTVYDSGHSIDGSATYTGSTVNPDNIKSVAVTLSGAVLGDTVIASSDEDLQGLTISAYVPASDVAQVIMSNNKGASVVLSGGTVRVKLIKKRP